MPLTKDHIRKPEGCKNNALMSEKNECFGLTEKHYGECKGYMNCYLYSAFFTVTEHAYFHPLTHSYQHLLSITLGSAAQSRDQAMEVVASSFRSILAHLGQNSL